MALQKLKSFWNSWNKIEKVLLKAWNKVDNSLWDSYNKYKCIFWNSWSMIKIMETKFENFLEYNWDSFYWNVTKQTQLQVEP